MDLRPPPEDSPLFPRPTPPPPPPSPRPWGFWASFAWAGLIVLVMVILQTLAALVYYRAVGTGEFNNFMQKLASDGFFESVAELMSVPVAVAIVWVVASQRRGLSPRAYLALRPVSWAVLGSWLVVAVGVAMAGDATLKLLGRPQVPDFMIDTYRTARFVPLLGLAVVVFGPVLEELLCRGFLFEGLRRSVVGPTGAIVLTAVVWALPHLQYDAVEVGIIMVVGLVLGLARQRTKSLYVPLAMHMLNNLLATIQAGLAVSHLS